MPRPLSALTRGRSLAAAGGLAVIAAIVAVVLVTSASGSAQGRPTMPAAHTLPAVTASDTTISSRKTSIGRVLFNASGDVLYAYSRDAKNRDVCVKVSGCVSEWPLVTGSPRAGSGVKKSLLGTIKVDGKRQVTYDGHPLYTFADAEPGSTAYVGEEESGGTWPAVATSGKLVS